MNIIRRLLNRNPPETAAPEPPAPSLDLHSWPSIPNEAKLVASLDALIAAESAVSHHAQKLKGEAAAAGYDAVDFQVTAAGKFGDFSLPALAKTGEGDFEILLSHAGEWVKDDVNRLLNWVLKVRSAESTAQLPIRLFHDGDSYPVWISEILSHQPQHLMILSILPYLEERHFVNAGLFAQSYQFTFGMTLPQDLTALAILDRAIRHKIAPVAEESFYKKYLVQTIGAFFGEMINRELNTSWTASPNPEIPWDVIPFGDMLLNPFGKVSKQLEDEADPAGMTEYMTFLLKHYKEKS